MPGLTRGGSALTVVVAPLRASRRETVMRVNAFARSARQAVVRGRAMSPLAMTLCAALIGIIATVVVAFVPGAYFAYRSLRGHLALETFDGCAAAAVTLLFFGRYQRTKAVTARRMMFAFLLLTLTSAYLVVLSVRTNMPDATAATWFPLATRLVAATLVALAAVAAPSRVHNAPGTKRAVLWVTVAFAGLALAAVLVPNDLPQPLDATISPELSGRPLFVGNTAIEAAQLAHAALYAVAAVAFTAHAARTRDAMTRWLGVGCTLAAIARVNYFLFPSLYSEWLYTGDFLRTGFYLALIVGGIRELQGYWSTQAEAAVFAERRRLARDLHDGAVQELGYIRALSRGLVRETEGLPSAERIAAAADRALAEARHAIEALSLPLDEPLGDLVRRAAGEIADRYDVDVTVDAADDVVAERTQREALVRIVREAISNAARHGGATHVDIQVRDGCLEISDNGTGFDLNHNGSGGFGLISMRDRADAMRGNLDIHSTPDGGTTVKVAWRGSR